MFFRDESDMGDVFDKAKKLLKDVKVLEGCTKSQRELIDKYHEQVENVRYGQVIKKLIGKKAEDFKSTVAGMMSEWNEKKNQLDEGIVAQQQTILEAENIINEINKSEIGENESINKELNSVLEISKNVKEQLDKIEKTKNIIDNILIENEEVIRDRVFSKEDVEFMRLDYFSLIQSRFNSYSVVNPLTGEEYNTEDWKINVEKDGIIAEIVKGVFRKRVSVRFEIKYILPNNEDGFIYQKIGKEVTNVIARFIQMDNKNSFSVLILLSPTGWSDWMIEKVEHIRNMNKSVYLIDLSERNMYFNSNDKTTKNFAEWFVPISMEEEIGGMVVKLEKEISAGASQFRVDKVASKYQVTRNIVMGAFREMVENDKGEIISIEDGAKDVLFRLW